MIWMTGSQALSRQLLLARKPHDYDLIMSREEYDDLIQSMGDDNLPMFDIEGFPDRKNGFVCGPTTGYEQIGVDIDISAVESSKKLVQGLLKLHHYSTRLAAFGGLEVLYPDVKTLWILKLSHAPFFADYPKFARNAEDVALMGSHIFGSSEGSLEGFSKDEQRLYEMRRQEAVADAKVRRWKDFGATYPITLEPGYLQTHALISGNTAGLFTLRGFDFHNLSFEEKIRAVRQEAIVQGIKRYWNEMSIRPGRDEMIYRYGLRSVATLLSMGGLRDFMWYNMHRLWNLSPDHYFADDYEYKKGLL